MFCSATGGRLGRLQRSVTSKYNSPQPGNKYEGEGNCQCDYDITSGGKTLGFRLHGEDGFGVLVAVLFANEDDGVRNVDLALFWKSWPLTILRSPMGG